MISCKDLPQVALDFMNTVHCEELTLVHELLQALEAGDENQVSTILDTWVEHTVQHFAREERLMQEYRFPPFPVHQGEHVHALELLYAARDGWQQNRDFRALEIYIRRDWQTWLSNHIGTMDRVTADYLSRFGIEVDLTQ